MTKGWVDEMDRLLRVDGRTGDQVGKVIVWLSTGTDPVAGFWRANVRSPKKLREKWDQMAEQYRERVKAGKTGSVSSRRFEDMTEEEWAIAYRNLPEADRVAAEQQRIAGLRWKAETTGLEAAPT